MGVLARIATMAGWTVRRTCSSLNDLVWLVALPIGLGIIISYVMAGVGFVQPPRVGVVDEDGTVMAGRLIEVLATTPFDVELMDRSEATEQIASGELEAALILPGGFGETVEAGAPVLELLRAEGSPEGLLGERAKAIATALARGEEPAERLVRFETPGGTVDDGTVTRVRLLFGVYLVFALTALIQRTAALHRERKAGLLQRIVGAGVPYGEVIVAHVVSLLLIGLVQAGVVLAVTGWLGTSWLAAGLAAILLPVLGSLFAGSGLAVALAGFVRSESQVQFIAGAGPSLLALLGGAFMPLDIVPAVVQRLAVLNPFFWAAEALEGGFVYRGWASQAGPLSVLLLIGVVGMVVGVQALRGKAVQGR